jgi:hypothetical protein
MIGAIGSFLGRFAIYITALSGLVALYFVWNAFHEWRAGRRAMFGVERDIAASEMIGAISRAGLFVLAGLVIFALGWLGQQADSDDQKAQATRPPASTAPVIATATPGVGETGPTAPPGDTPQVIETPVLPLPLEPTTEPQPTAPTQQRATVIAFGGVWLRDAPAGGTIAVVAQGAVVEFLEGREFAGQYEWQKVRIVDVPLSSLGQADQAQPDQEGWIAFAPDFLEVNP